MAGNGNQGADPAATGRRRSREIGMAGNGNQGADLEQGGARYGAFRAFRAFCPMLDKQVLLNHLPALATATLLGVTAINVLSSNQSLSGDDTTTHKALRHKALRQFLLAMPYSLFLFALAILAAAFAVQGKPAMLGCAVGCLLVQLVCLVVNGGIVTLVRGEVDPRIVWPVTAGIVAIVIFTWSVMCAYPKCLRRLLLCCCRSKKKEQVVVADEECETCGGKVVEGRSANPAGEGNPACDRCGGVAPPLV